MRHQEPKAHQGTTATPSQRTRSQPTLLLLGLLLLLGCVCAPIASATDFTWSGEGPTSADNWSNGANWVGGSAPAPFSSIGTLNLPSLPTINCPNLTPTTAGYISNNDLNGLTIEHLQLDNLFISCSYEITGQGITLGSGGLSAAPTDAYGGSAQLLLPITLGASQTWNLTGPVGGTEPDIGGNVTAEALSGASADLAVNLSDGSGLYLYGDNEVGDVTVKAGNFGSGSINFLGEPGHVVGLNASDGHSLTLEGVDLAEQYSAVGSLNSVGSTINVGWPYQANPGTLSTTSASFDAASDLEFEIANVGTSVGSDYAQLTSTGNVSLGSAYLAVSETLRTGECPSLPLGQEYTLISTTGSLSGQFSNAPNGGTIFDEDICTNSYRIDYHETGPVQTVTATVVPYRLPANLSPPTITGTATEGQTLTETHGQWTNNPTSYSYQWERCTPVGAGLDCQNISGATAQTYTLAAIDVGTQVGVVESARNSQGSSPRQVGISALTAIVQAAGSGGSTETGGSHERPPGNTGSQETGSNSQTNNPGSTSSTGLGSSPSASQAAGSTSSGHNATASISSAQIAALLNQELVPIGKAIRIGALLKTGGLSLPFKALEAGVASVQWYMVPKGATIAGNIKPKPVLVASGKLVFAGAGMGQVKIRLTSAGKKVLKRSRQVRLVVRGEFVGGAVATTTKGLDLRR
jgi:hypothetical protein